MTHSRLSVPTLIALLSLSAGARDQCIPGPFTYDDGGQFTDGNGDQLPTGNCFGPGCSDFACNSDGECQNFLGPDAECIDGVCFSFQSCSLNQLDDSCDDLVAGTTCAYDPSSDSPRDFGVCRPVASAPVALGERCPLDALDVNPCGGGGYCLPVDDDEGLCVTACDNGSACGGGFTCTAPYLFTGGAAVCMPSCNLDAASCGDPRLVCTQGQFDGGGCTPDNGACTIAGCDNDECFDLCSVGADDCGAGSFCIETTITNCRIDGPDQSFAACAPPSGENGPCSLTEPESCTNGFACGPFGFDGPRCVQQSSTPVNDGESCDPSDQSVNRCPAGSFCARTFAGGGNDGVCQRFCDDEGDCDGSQVCARANLATFAADNPFADVRVCAEPCTANTTCANGFLCDVDAAPCTSDGACVPNEGASACIDDDDCSFSADFICSGDFKCTLPEDACLETACVLTDAATCQGAFSCSPFFSESPLCVAQRDVVPDGGACNVGDGSTTQCGSGSVCTGSVCMRACDDNGDCTGAQQCVRGNLFEQGSSDDPLRLADVTVCAEPCVAFGPCDNGLTCDIDGGQSCNSGNGHCLAQEISTVFCSNNADCAPLPGTVCHPPTGQCLLSLDVCTP